MEACDKKSKSGSIQGKLKLYLGNKDNPQYHTYKAAIRRRNELQELQRRYDKLTALYEKLLSTPVSYGYLSEAFIGEELEKTETNKGAIDLRVTKELVKAVERIQETMSQLSHWMEAIGEKLGVNATDVSFESG